MKVLWLTVKLVCLGFVVYSAAAIASPAQVLTVLHSFDSSDGSMPYAGLVQASDGNLYGTSAYGGSSRCYLGCGTIFKITPSGTLTTLYVFCTRSSCTDGSAPFAGLVQSTDGNFYGTTLTGGDSQSCNGGCGTVFKITPSGTLTTLYSFCSQSGCSDGSTPFAGLVQATDGDFYGTTSSGGANNFGTVFKITPSGTLTTLHSFQFSDGIYPEAALVQAADRNFYGTTYEGGSGCGANGCGTVFKITPDGTLTTLHMFADSDGQRPVGGVVQASDGNFYGTTSAGGIGNCVEGCGTVVKITPNGIRTVLHLFTGPDGGNPDASLIQASDGNFYGTTYVRGAYNFGTVFKITPNGTLTTLLSFTPSEGFYPYAGLVQASDGNFYGTASDGGYYSYYGTVFRLVLPRSCIVCATVE